MSKQPQQPLYPLWLNKYRRYHYVVAGTILGVIVTLFALYASDEGELVACLVLGPTIILTSLSLASRESFLGIRTPAGPKRLGRVLFMLYLWSTVVLVIVGLLYKFRLLGSDGP